MTGVDLADEDRKFMEYLAENGWTGSVGEDAEEDIDNDEKQDSEEWMFPVVNLSALSLHILVTSEAFISWYIVPY